MSTKRNAILFIEGNGHITLSRGRDEIIMIGDNVGFQIVDIRGDKVRIRVSAPKNVEIHRKEVYDAINSQRSSQVNGEVPRKSIHLPAPESYVPRLSERE